MLYCTCVHGLLLCYVCIVLSSAQIEPLMLAVKASGQDIEMADFLLRASHEQTRENEASAAQVRACNVCYIVDVFYNIVLFVIVSVAARNGQKSYKFYVLCR